jgi:hypothetical protein
MVALLLWMACTPSPPPAPQTLDAALLAILHADSDDSVLAHAATLAALVDRDVVPNPDGVRLGPVAAAELDGLDLDPSTDPARLLGGAQQRIVAGALDRYAALVPLADQSFVGGYARWDRTVVSGDAEAWADGAPLGAEDVVEKEAPFGIVLPYTLAMEATWGTGDDGAPLVLFRSRIPRAGWSEDGGSAVIAGLTVELWRPAGTGRTAWFNATWTQVVTPLGDAATDDFLVSQVLDGAAEVIDGSEAWLRDGEAR